MYYFDEEKHMDHQRTFNYGKNTSREAAIEDRGVGSPYSTVQEQLKLPTLLSRSFVRLTAFFGSADGRNELGRPGRHRSREWRSGW
jgi:hypothetical protein